eukprot:373673-Amphidinium_carterae.1
MTVTADIDDNKVTVYTGDKPYIEQFGNNEQLHHIGAHLHVASMVLPGFHTPNEIKLDNTVNTRYSLTPPDRKGALKEQSTLHFDYAYNNPADKKMHTISTGVETTTGLCVAIPIK